MIVGFCGNARSGKNEAALVLEQMWGFTPLSFAQPIRNFVIDFLGLDGMSEYEIVKETPHYLFGGKSPREVMQKLGTEFGRDMIYTDMWVDRCIETATRVENSVIYDVRFDNEAQKVVDAGGIIIELIRPNNSLAINSNHASEVGIDKKFITKTITNDSDVYKFRRKVYDAYITLPGKYTEMR